MPYRIAVYFITKNEEELLERAIKSALDADEIYVGDTGNSQATKELCEKYKVKYVPVNIIPFRFDDARNAVLSSIATDIDICVPLDSDEVLADGWKTEVETKWTPEATILRYMYDWSKGVTFMQAKIHARNGYRWTRPCHEIITRYAEGADVYSSTDKFLMFHHPDDSKPRSYYLPLLRMGYKEAPNDDRSVFYYGRELYLRSNYAGITEDVRAACKREGTRVLREALDLIKNAPNRAEASYAWRMIGEMNKDEEAFKMAIKEAPHMRDPYIFYADYLYHQKRFSDAKDQVDLALDIKERTGDYMVDPKCWSGYPLHLYSWCLYHLGMLTLAIKAQEDAIKIEPNEYYEKCRSKFVEEKAKHTTTTETV